MTLKPSTLELLKAAKCRRTTVARLRLLFAEQTRELWQILGHGGTRDMILWSKRWDAMVRRESQ